MNTDVGFPTLARAHAQAYACRMRGDGLEKNRMISKRFAVDELFNDVTGTLA